MWGLSLAAAAAALVTAVAVLWFPIDQAAITRADEAGWDESLLLPNQFALTAALAGAWLLGVASAALSLVLLLRSRH